MLPKLTVLELKMKPITSPHPLCFTVGLYCRARRRDFEIGRDKGHNMVERNGFLVHRLRFKSWDLLSFCFLIGESG